MEGRAKNMLLFQTDRLTIECRDNFDAGADLFDTWCADKAEWVLPAIIEGFKAVELPPPTISGDGCIQPAKGLLLRIQNIFGE